jgi:hypothetical protein
MKSRSSHYNPPLNLIIFLLSFSHPHHHTSLGLLTFSFRKTLRYMKNPFQAHHRNIFSFPLLKKLFFFIRICSPKVNKKSFFQKSITQYPLRVFQYHFICTQDFFRRLASFLSSLHFISRFSVFWLCCWVSAFSFSAVLMLTKELKSSELKIRLNYFTYCGIFCPDSKKFRSIY